MDHFCVNIVYISLLHDGMIHTKLLQITYIKANHFAAVEWKITRD